ncbi:MAG: 23S rRNA (adenine(2503)-C(2))-methyltransferase RlmN [Polyangiaceae bacterium]|nr:23S rRNA (adenine(2503)-C(2))-methyltransferase RlmN [Polyangiaceae bacterium]
MTTEATKLTTDPIDRYPEELAENMRALDEKPYRAAQIFEWIHRRGVSDPERMTDLSLPLREKLKTLGVAPRARLQTLKAAEDGTRKLVLEMRESATVECVLIPMTPLGDQLDADAAAVDDTDEDVEPGRTRVTLCISTQFGCAMGCVFCASGQAGLFRGLSAAEIVSQVYLAREHLTPGEDLKNLVFMGMGEPLHHYDETARALRLLTHQKGLGMGARRITVSTVGLVPGIKKLGEDFGGKIGLALSLHAPDDATRDRIMPMNKRYPLAELRRALDAYPLPNRRRITIEYILIDGVNSSLEQARKLAQFLKGLRVKINLIPMNPIAASEHRAPNGATVRAFQEVLAEKGFSCFVRGRRGDEVDAACGQLALSEGLVALGRSKKAARGESG